MRKPIMRQAIETRYLAQTNKRNARVAAWCAAGRVILPWDSRLTLAENSIRAAGQLIRQLHWDDMPWQGGGLKNGGYAFTSVDPKEGPTIPAA